MPRRPLAAICASAVFASASLAQDQPADDAVGDKWKQAYQKIAESIEMRSGDTVLKMHDRPFLFYTNPVVDTDQHGAIFLWTRDGRPAILGSIWSARNRMDDQSRFVAHEWHSLSDDAELAANRAGQVLATAPAEGKPSAWQYAIARMHVGALAVRHGDKEIWSVTEMSHPYARTNERDSLFQKIPEPDVD